MRSLSAKLLLTLALSGAVLWPFAAHAGCRFQTALGTLSFGSLDPASGMTVPAGPITLAISCSPPSDFSLLKFSATSPNFSGGTYRMLRTAAPAAYINYSIAISGAPDGKGSSGTMTLGGTVAGPDYANAPSGFYEDTLTINIFPL